MSRIGKRPISLPGGVSVSIEAGKVVVTGPKGTLEYRLLPGINVEAETDKVTISRESDAAEIRARHGLVRSLIQNMVTGVSKGFEKKLELQGVGYRVASQGHQLKFNIGFSHETIYKVPDSVQVTADQNVITISGSDKQLVGQVAAEIRALKKPEPYKGKGIRYLNEHILRKSGKSGKEAA
ncbi:MAG TPA: 50S ribosomal protein L6 [Candidatus Saccharimonadales bacterium]|nr:50S ribosomal protein L6 [Candidatus Saccharimonadales bacterium]